MPGVARLSHHLGVLAAVAAIFMTATVLAVAIWLTQQLDRDAREKTRWMVAGSLRTLVGSDALVAQDYAHWTAAYEAVRRTDLDWLDANLGSGADDGGIIDVLVIGGGPLPETRGWAAARRALLAPDLDAIMEAGQALAARDGDPAAPAPLSTFVQLNGTVWLISVHPVIAHDRPPDPAEPVALLVAGHELDAARAAEIGEAILLDDMRLATTPDPALDLLALEGTEGPVGYLAWTPPKPGAAALRAVLPPLTLALMVGALTLMAGTLAVGRLAKRLERALVASEAADRTKAEFIAGLSHELRTPMNGIVGMLELLQTTPLAPDQREFVEIALGSAETQVDLIEHLLAFGNLDAGHRHLSLAPLVPAEVIRAAVALCEPAACDKGLALRLEEEGDAGLTLLGDRMAIRQIALNLIGNAIKFTDAGSVRVRLSVRGTLGGHRMVLSVADTGPGIAAADRDRIFESFVQGDGSMTRAAGGVGLGLAISRRLAGQMDGALTVESVPGQGATFRLDVVLETPVWPAASPQGAGRAAAPSHPSAWSAPMP